MSEIGIAITAAIISALAGVMGVLLQVVYSRKSERFKKYYDYQVLRYNQIRDFKEKVKAIEEKYHKEFCHTIRDSKNIYQEKAYREFNKFKELSQLFDEYKFYFKKESIEHIEKEEKSNSDQIIGNGTYILSKARELDANRDNKEDTTEIVISDLPLEKELKKIVEFQKLIKELYDSELRSIVSYLHKN